MTDTHTHTHTLSLFCCHATSTSHLLFMHCILSPLHWLSVLSCTISTVCCKPHSYTQSSALIIKLNICMTSSTDTPPPISLHPPPSFPSYLGGQGLLHSPPPPSISLELALRHSVSLDTFKTAIKNSFKSAFDL